MAIGVLAWGIVQPAQCSVLLLLACVAVFAPMAVFGFQSFRRLRDSVAVNDEGLWYLPRNGSPRFLAWRDVATVRAADTAQRLVLSDAYGERVIRLEYQLDKFNQLREFVVEHTSASSQGRGSATPSVFHHSWINKGIFLFLLVVSGIPLSLLIRRGDPHALQALGVMAVICLGLFIRDPSRVRLESHAVIIEYPGWRRSIPYNTIIGIELTAMQNRGNTWAVVLIRRKKGRPIRLIRFNEGSIVLREALDCAWRAAGGDRASGQGGGLAR
jgi:hypothetical protein